MSGNLEGTPEPQKSLVSATCALLALQGKRVLGQVWSCACVRALGT